MAGAVSIMRHEAEICITPLMRYLCSGPQELHLQFYIKAEMISSLEARIITGILYVFLHAVQ